MLANISGQEQEHWPTCCPKSFQKSLWKRQLSHERTQGDMAHSSGGIWQGYCVNLALGVKQKSGQMEWLLCDFCLWSPGRGQSRSDLRDEMNVLNWSRQQTCRESSNLVSLCSEHPMTGENGDNLSSFRHHFIHQDSRNDEDSGLVRIYHRGKVTSMFFLWSSTTYLR